MQFLVIGYDGTDEKALDRRMAARPAHIILGDKMRAEGKALYGVVILDEKEKMIGSVYICNFPSRKELDEWLKIEPYMTGNVWQKVEISQCKVGPSFASLHSQVI